MRSPYRFEVKRMTQLHCFITGVSSGIGRATLDEAVQQGWKVSGCARRVDVIHELTETYQTDTCLLVGDVTDDHSIETALRTAVEQNGPIDIVIANAGYGLDGELLELSPEDVRAVFDTNVIGVHRTIRAARAYLTTNARICIVSSVAAFLPIPRMGAYCASKHAVECYAAALRMELADAGIRVQTLCPGTVRTDFFDNAHHAGSVWDWRPGSALPVQVVAKALVRQTAQGSPARIRLPWYASFAAAFYQFCPRLAEWQMKRALRKMR